MRILGVALLDHETMGHDIFIVEEGPDQVVQYEATTGGEITAVSPVQNLDSVAASIEKFNHGYFVDPPIDIEGTKDLVGYIGKFEATSATMARLK